MPGRRRFRPRVSRTVALRAEGTAVGIEVREVAGAKRLRLRIRQDGTVHVTVPPRTSERRIDGFLAENERWLARSLADHAVRSSRLGLAAAGTVPLGGELVPVVRAAGTRPHAVLEAVGGQTVVAVSGPPASAAGALERLLREEARLGALELLARHEPAVGARPGRVRISDPLTRWGSASTRGTLSFSWRLALAPGFVFEYVAVHELCHLLELNHSPRFWAHVERVLSDYERGRAWLRDHGAELRGWDPRLAVAAT